MIENNFFFLCSSKKFAKESKTKIQLNCSEKALIGAFQIFTQALEIDEFNVIALTNLGIIANERRNNIPKFKGNQYKDLDFYIDAIISNPNNSKTALNNLKVILLERKSLADNMTIDYYSKSTFLYIKYLIVKLKENDERLDKGSIRKGLLDIIDFLFQ